MTGVDSPAQAEAREAARRDLARLKRRLPLRRLDAAAEARIRMAIHWGKAVGRAGAERRW